MSGAWGCADEVPATSERGLERGYSNGRAGGCAADQQQLCPARCRWLREDYGGKGTEDNNC